MIDFDFSQLIEPVNPADAYLQGIRDRLAADDSKIAKGKRPRPEKKPKVPGGAPKSDFNPRSCEWMREQGWNPVRVDYFDHLQKRHFDFMGLFDYIALGTDETIAVQITSVANMSTRRNKILGSPGLGMLKRAGWKVLILGWAKGSNGRFGAPRVEWL